MNAKESFFK